MPDIAVNQVIQTRIEWECLGQKDLTVWHWNVAAANAGVEMFNWLRAGLNQELLAVGGIVTQLLAVMSDQCKCTGVTSQVIHPTRYHGVHSISTGIGADASPVGTNNLALSVGYSPVLAGRGRSGRTQVPGLPKKYVVDGRWDVAATTPVYNALAPFRTTQWAIILGGVKLDPILFSPDTAFKNPIIDATVYNTVRTMYRRTVGVGD